MARPPRVDRPVRVEVQLPQSVHSKLQIELYSEVEGRVPHGAFSNLMKELVSAWLRTRGYTL